MKAITPFENSCLGGECTTQLCQQMKRELGFFSFLSDVELDSVSAYFHCRTVSARSTLWSSGDPCAYIAFIIAGRIQVKVDTEFPGKQVVVGIFSRGAVIGTSCAVDTQPRRSSAVAMEDSGLILITYDNINRLIDEHPRIGTKLLKGMLLSESSRLQQAYARLASIF